MLSSIVAPRRSTPQLIEKGRLSLTALDQSLTSRHDCPCCSYVLLRHIRLGELYWRCSHCYEAMPAWS